MSKSPSLVKYMVEPGAKDSINNPLVLALATVEEESICEALSFLFLLISNESHSTDPGMSI